MKRVIAICLMCSLSACASMNGKDSNPDSSTMTSKQENSSGYDEKYMARVDRAASQNGVTVRWINPPKVLKAKKDGQ